MLNYKQRINAHAASYRMKMKGKTSRNESYTLRNKKNCTGNENTFENAVTQKNRAHNIKRKKNIEIIMLCEFAHRFTE